MHPARPDRPAHSAPPAPGDTPLAAPRWQVLTWWSVSSCTSDERVARNFMAQLGGKATLLTLRCRSAMDITPLSLYQNEKESLLAPGTKLKVCSGSGLG